MVLKVLKLIAIEVRCIYDYYEVYIKQVLILTLQWVEKIEEVCLKVKNRDTLKYGHLFKDDYSLHFKILLDYSDDNNIQCDISTFR